MPTISHPNGQTTFYQADCFADPWTEPETIVIQHGYGRNGNFWYHWIPILSHKYNVIRRDARGHGGSSIPDKATYPYTVDTVLEEIVDTLDQLKLKKVHWLGESTGGIWGELLAARHPDRLLSLTICGSPLFMPKAAGDMLAFGHATPWDSLRAIGSREWGEKALVLLGNQDFSPEHHKWWVDQIASVPGYSLADHGELLWDKDFDSRPVMHDIKVPMLLLSPAESPLVDLEDQKRLHAAVVGSEMVIVEGVGHEIYIDQAGKCQTTFLAFLKTLPNFKY